MLPSDELIVLGARVRGASARLRLDGRTRPPAIVACAEFGGSTAVRKPALRAHAGPEIPPALDQAIAWLDRIEGRPRDGQGRPERGRGPPGSLTAPEGSAALLRGGGSIGIIGAARAGLIVGCDPDDPNRRVLALSKSNLAPDTRSSLIYRVETDAEYDVGRLRWLGTCDRTARDLLATDQDPTGAVGDAASILREFLEDGPQLATEAKRYCRDAGISGRTLDRAKKFLGVHAQPRVNGDGRKWWWSMPTEERQGGRL